MELKQLEYFVCVAKLGSINNAAKELFTSQPNVSKTIHALEKELQALLFVRHSKGVKLTIKGKELYEYAKNTLKNVNMITEIASRHFIRKLEISSYPSRMIARALCDYYKDHGQDDLKIDFIEGSVEKIVKDVWEHRSEIGFLYVSQEQKCCFKHTLEHKNLVFHTLALKPCCVYAGEHHPLYEKGYVELNELSTLKFVQPEEDFFTQPYQIRSLITTNSDHALMDLLLTTDFCTFGIDFMYDAYRQYPIKTLPIKGYNQKVYIGYIQRKAAPLSEDAEHFVALIKKMLK
jgi:DNA-binding transcriptional LysR family regulator